MSTKKAVFYTLAFFLFVLIVPQLCAQNEVKMSPSEAAVARQKLVDYSKQFIGKPYVSGGIGPNSFDCSGLIFTVSRESIGVQLPRTTQAIYNFCSTVSAKEREAGDLVFFKTTASGKISHVGLYIGNSQFIHAASDGPNTGVIISSLKEGYWKSHYFETRRYLPASNSELLVDAGKTNVEKANAENGGEKSGESSASSSAGFAKSSVSSGGGSFLDCLVMDASFSVDWSLVTPDYFRLNYRGLESTVHARYAGENLQPGLGTIFRYDAGTGVFQIPLIVSLTLNDYVRIFAGPVITLGEPHLPGNSDRKIESSFFPGILGVSLCSPAIEAGKILLSLVQDIHYTIFNETDGSALSFTRAVPTGLVFATGLRVTLPLKNVL